MASYNKFQAFVADICNKVHNLGSDICKVMLTNVAPVAANSVKANLTEISAGNGYTAGGTAVGSPSSTQTGGTYTFSGNNVTFTASGGAIATFRYIALYNSTTGSGNLISYFDYGAPVDLQSGDSFTVAWNGGGSSGTIFTLT